MVNHTKNILDIIADFLRIELDSIFIQTRLSSNKLDRARKTITDLLKRATISHRELESAIEFLSFATKIVIPGRAFLRRLFDVIRRSMTIIRLFTDMKADLLWWKTFLKDWNNLKLLRNVASRRSWYIWTNVSRKLDIEGYILKHPDLLSHVQNVFSTRVTSRYTRKDIQFKKMTVILYVIRVWVNRLSDTRLILHCDNENCVHELRKFFIRESAMISLRTIAMLIVSHDILLIPIWISIKANELTNNLSRFRYRKIADKYPQLNHLSRHRSITPPR